MRWPPERRALEGSLIRLEPIATEHHDGLLAASREVDTWRWIDPRVPGDDAAFRRWFDTRLDASNNGAEWCLVICRRVNGEPIGSSSYLSPRPEHDGVEIGWTWLHPAAWSTGANVDAKLLMLGHAFDALGAMRVEFKTDARNERSRGALAALPATFEGIFRNHMLMPEIGRRDSAYFSIVDEDWPDVRSRLESRLEGHARVDAVRRAYAALGAEDRSAFEAIVTETIHPQCEWAPFLTGVEGRTYRGQDGMLEFYDDFIGVFRPAYDIESISPVGDDALLVLGAMTIQGRESGVEVRQEMGALFEFEDGLIKRGEATDQKSARAAAEAIHA